MKKIARVLSLTFALLVLCTSLISADEISNSSKEMKIGEITTLDYYISPQLDPNGKGGKITDENQRRKMMKQQGKLPGTTFVMNNQKYLVLDDYKIKFLEYTTNLAFTTTSASITPRSSNIPTAQGSLPYYGSYSMYNYVYTNRYFNIGDNWVQVSITPLNDHYIRIQSIDATNDQPMENGFIIHATNPTYYMAGCIANSPFYIKFTNEGTNKAIANFSITY